MKIIGTTKLTTPCIWTNIGKGIEGAARELNIPYIIYDYYDFTQRKILADNDDIIFIFEAGFAQSQHTGWDIEQLKKIWPNSKFIALGSDVSVWLYIHGKDQLNFSYVDLLLDLDERTRSHYSNKNIQTDKWVWTISNWLIEQINIYRSNYPIIDKIYDFISVIFSGTIGEGYRKKIIDTIHNMNMSFTNGGGNSHDDNDLNRLFQHYNQSKIALGISNLGIREDFQTIKGFRDFIAPFFDIPILYDNWIQVINIYGEIMPYYEYGSLKDLYDISQTLIYNQDIRKLYINKQKKFAIDNTIDKQLINILKKYNYV